MRAASRLLPHQAEFAFLSRNLERVPHGSTVVSVWLKMLNERRDADTAGDRELLRTVAVLCRQLETMTSRWEARQKMEVRESTVHLVEERLELGLGWVETARR